MNTNSVDFFKNQPLNPIPETQKLIIAVWKIRNPNNMGNIIRLGHNLGATNVQFIDDNIEKRESKIRKTAGFSFDQQAWEFISEETFLSSIPAEYSLIALETCSGSNNIFEIELPEKIILFGGNESHGLPARIIEKCASKVFIPMPGACKSMNISHALTVAGFEWYSQNFHK